MAETSAVPLGEFVEVTTGFPFASSHYTDDKSGVRLLRGDNVAQGRLRWEGVKRWPSDLVADYESYTLAENDVVLAMDRPWIEAGLKFSAVSHHDLPCLLVQRVARLRAKPGLDQGFLRRLIASADFTRYVLGTQTGTAVPHISGDQIRQYRVVLPPLSEQRAIAEVLGALDDKIEANRNLSGLLESRLATLFVASEFDTVDEVGTENVRLDTLLEVNPARPRPPTDAAPYLDMAALPVDSALVAAARVRKQRSGTRFLNRDVLMARITPCLENGKVAYVDCLRADEVGIGSTEFIVLHGRDGIPTHLAYFLARSPRFRDFAVRHMSGSSGRQRCPADAVAGYTLQRPARDSLDKFAREAELAFPMMRAMSDESLLLAALCDVLLPKLLSGELWVRDAETLVEEAV